MLGLLGLWPVTDSALRAQPSEEVADNSENEWTWTDRTGETRTRQDLDEILIRHRGYLESGETSDRADLREANLVRADLREADLSEADLSRARLSGANLREANLVRADLSEADLSGADLYRANLPEANLYTANLRGANLYRANLREARLSGADLREADLSFAFFEPRAIPEPDRIFSAKGFGRLRYQDPSVPTRLSRSLSGSGYDQEARLVNVSLRRGEAQWWSTALFDWTCQYGTDPTRPILLIGLSALVFSGVYFLSVLFPLGAGIYRLSSPGEVILLRRGRVLETFGAASLFSLWNALAFGSSTYSVGSLLLPRSLFGIRARKWTGWVSSLQSLNNLYLLSLVVMSGLSVGFESAGFVQGFAVILVMAVLFRVVSWTSFQAPSESVETTGSRDLGTPGAQDQQERKGPVLSPPPKTAEVVRPEWLKRLEENRDESARIAERMNRLARAFLVIGGFIAAAGVVYFATTRPIDVLRSVEPMTASTTAELGQPSGAGAPQPSGNPGRSAWDAVGLAIALMLPNLGIVAFIEVIAMFFLRQYREAMDRYRHFEAVKRHREELLSLVTLMHENPDSIDVGTLIKHGAFFSQEARLAQGETTDALERRKLVKDELDVLEKAIGLVKRSS